MTVATKVLPDVTTQDATTYKGSIDATAAVHDRIAGAFAAHQSAQGSPSDPDMTVTVDAGYVFDGTTLTEVAQQVTSVITAPVTNPRIDRIVVDKTTGAVSVITGAEAASPSAPTITSNKTPVARVLLATSTTAITNSMITDERVPSASGSGAIPYAAAGGTVDAITADFSPDLTLTDGLIVAVKLAGANTSTTPTFAPDGGTARTIVKSGAQALGAGDLSRANAIALFAYNLSNTRWELLNPVVPDDIEARLTFLEVNLAVNTLRDQIDAGWAYLYMADGVSDEFEDETGVNTTASTGETYNSTGDYYHNPNEAQVSGGTGTAIGDMTGAGGLAAAFDGNSSQTGDNSARETTNSGTGNIGKDWGSGNTKVISRFTIIGGTDQGFCSGGNPGAMWFILQGSNNGSSWTDLLTTATFADTGTAVLKDYSTGIDTSTAYRYHRVQIKTQSAGAAVCAELVFYELSGATNMVLQSIEFEPEATPNDVRLVVLHQPVDLVTLNTDLLAYVSRNGGATWTQATLTNEGAFDSTTDVLTATVDISAQSVGSPDGIMWRLTVANNKSQRIHGVWMQWR